MKTVLKVSSAVMKIQLKLLWNEKNPFSAQTPGLCGFFYSHLGPDWRNFLQLKLWDLVERVVQCFRFRQHLDWLPPDVVCVNEEYQLSINQYQCSPPKITAKPRKHPTFFSHAKSKIFWSQKLQLVAEKYSSAWIKIIE